ncbi:MULTISPECIES: hypothetical protein [Bacillus cereus group]|uniref:DUF2304 domain-containing protein n=2 Tax=Bacillus cereus group TaxID=86661 RepID=A0AB73UT24_BACCE|nr:MULTISPECIES: hypothetical protein [Bacillus cereus group]MED3540695.1 hypothetical protein [Bacillus toyonensis]MEE2019336.1 hypothetical protein [Bacillus toyonensis]OUB78183.1 hypothetical protein BK750_00515 [Bacillus thuringiensis serovar jegathesan]QHV08102.1 hypothetical protein C1N82_33450 [Bacillus cereus]QHV47604.1 hypothetical protein C1N66_31910 [Bacillus cereus]
MIFFKVIAYILLSIGVCTVVLAGIAAIGKKQIIIANIHLLLAMYYFCSGSLLYLCTLWETQDIFLQAFLILIVGITIMRLRKSWYVPQMRTLQKLQEEATSKNNL